MNRKQKAFKNAAPGRERINLTEGILLFSPFLTGLFHLWGAAFAVIALTAALAVLQKKEALRISLSPLLLSCCSLVLFLSGGCLWGTDRGMALAGTLKFLPLPLFVLALQQRKLEDRMRLLRFLPQTAALMVLLSFFLSRIPAWADHFLVNGRLAGFFQYPNTFAAYLLAALIVLIHGQGDGSSVLADSKSRPLVRQQKPPACLQPLLFAVLLFGLALAQSKAAIILLIAVLILSAVRADLVREKRLFGLSAALFAGAGLFLLLRGPVSFSTFFGRLLYARDALPVILRHPLGLGYTGYYWLQGSFQTGVYSVRHVHNELLQLLLDVGWIPAGLFLWAMVQSFRSPDGNFCRKLLLAVLCLHALADFDTQFLSVAFLMLTSASVEPCGSRRISPRVFAAVSIPVCLFSFWLGTAALLLYEGRPSEAANWYPAYTEALVRMLPEAENNRTEELADRILRLNVSCAPAWDVKAEAAFRRGDFDEAISAKEEAVHLSRYNRQEYWEYQNLLERIRVRCLSRGDAEGAARCSAKLEAIPEMAQNVLAQTSALGRMIQDQPNLSLPPLTEAQANRFGKTVSDFQS